MQYTLDPDRITKQMLLSLHTEEEYMSHYLGIIPSKGLHCNPLRVDKKPTASFYRSKSGELIFKDFQTGFHANFVDVVIAKFNTDLYRALRIIARDFGIISKASGTRNEPAIKYDGSVIEGQQETVLQCEVKDFTNKELLWWKSFGISESTLKRFHVYSVKHVFLNGNYLLTSSLANPTYGYYFGKEEGRELWKIYFPLKEKFRFLLNTSKLQGASQLPATGEYVVVTKSMKDVMTLYELGIPAVAPQAESVIIKTQQYNALKKRFKQVIFNADWDRAGQRFMIESRRKFGTICLSFVDKSKDAKDISDYAQKHGFDKAVLLIEALKYQLKEGLLNYMLRYAQNEVE